MEFKGNVEVVIKTKDSSTTEVFENEHLDFSRSSRLGIINRSEDESELIKMLTMWKEQDDASGVRSYLNIKTDSPSTVESFRDYYFEKVNEEKKMVIFNWLYNH